MLRVEDIHSYYGDSYILQGLSLQVNAGEVVAVLGRNGVGKTTLVRSVIGLTPPRKGRIVFKEVDITRLPAHRIARMGIGLVPQGRRIFASLTVRENLQVIARGAKDARWNLERIMDLFPNLGRRLRQLGGKLSGGEQQMLAAGRALVANPDLLLMDEPSEGLAPLIVRELGRVIDTLKQSGTAVLLIEQQLRFAMRHADRCYVMSKGRVVHHCKPAELAADAETRARYLGVSS
jgi:branched-chain amino acid transport system ATP-binding protein